MVTYVVSAPRSGLNWLRFCTEHFLGLPTPGKRLILPPATDDGAAFVRSHDALALAPDRKEGGAYRTIDPAATGGDRVLLILRDPLETFVRMARKDLGRFAPYWGNVRFFDLAAAREKKVVHYQDLVADPSAMFEALAFLGAGAPSLDVIRAGWDEAGAQSRARYHKNQFWGGGAQTRRRPLDFTFHQEGLTEAERGAVWAELSARLTPAQFDLVRAAAIRPPA